MTVEVIDVDEYEPKIKEIIEELQIDCDEADKELMKISAEDEDCSDDICEFQILHQEDSYFNISNQGIITFINFKFDKIILILRTNFFNKESDKLFR